MSSPYDLKDYAYPCMMAEKALQEVHQAILRNDYAEAQSKAGQALIECAMMLDAIKTMKGQHHAVRQQA